MPFPISVIKVAVQQANITYCEKFFISKRELWLQVRTGASSNFCHVVPSIPFQPWITGNVWKRQSFTEKYTCITDVMVHVNSLEIAEAFFYFIISIKIDCL